MQAKNTLRPAPAILETASALRRFVRDCRHDNKTLALVPTMGALHEGHLALVREALDRADQAIVSIFVNPAQFGPGEDFAAYPRTWDPDLEKLTRAGAQAVFYPSASEIYPQDFATSISVIGVSAPLEGAHRPGHFDGVATVVAKLLLLSLPDLALFGEKDWQQLQVIRRLVSDLNIPVEICGVPTMRDEHGLALSSRNAYLSEQELAIARRLNRTLFAMAEKIRQGEAIDDTTRWGQEQLHKAGFDRIDYLEVRDAASLQPPGENDLRILAAVRLGKARLIDNVPI